MQIPLKTKGFVGRIRAHPTRTFDHPIAVLAFLRTRKMGARMPKSKRRRLSLHEAGKLRKAAAEAGLKLPRPKHRRVRAGNLYYVLDTASVLGWSVVEIEEHDPSHRAAFVPGQLEAVPLAEIGDRILGPVPEPSVTG